MHDCRGRNKKFFIRKTSFLKGRVDVQKGVVASMSEVENMLELIGLGVVFGVLSEVLLQPCRFR